MDLPVFKKCCGCITLDTGCALLAVASLTISLVDVGAGAWSLSFHRRRQPEDNLISLSMVTFSSLSALSNTLCLIGIWIRRPKLLQQAVLLNTLFMTFCFTVALVTCLFSPEYEKYIGHSSWAITLAVLAFIGAAGFCVYYTLIVNSLYRKMKITDHGMHSSSGMFSDSATMIPV